ncbi:MAG: DUF1854 domain-containing protein [Bacillota bacterium]
MNSNEAWRENEYTEIATAGLCFIRDNFRRILMLINGKIAHRNVRPVRAFPLTSPGMCVIIQSESEEELGIIYDLSLLDADSRKVIEEDLENAALATRILAVSHVKVSHGMTTWRIKTDRGDRVIYVKDRQDIRWLPGKKVVLTDINGLKFTIDDADGLDERSRLLLEGEA